MWQTDTHTDTTWQLRPSCGKNRLRNWNSSNQRCANAYATLQLPLHNELADGEDDVLSNPIYTKTWKHHICTHNTLITGSVAPIAWKYLILNFPPSTAELFRLPPHRSGTHYQTQSFRHQHCGRSSTNWKLFYFNDPLSISTVIVVSQ